MTFRHWWWIAAFAVAAVLWFVGAHLERTAVLAACILATVAVILPNRRQQIADVTTCLLLAACLSLAAHLIGDEFNYRYVWLYSASSLPWYLKLANLWGGDEGTILFLATLMGYASTRLVRYRGWAGPGALLLTASFALGASVWSPFSPTPADDLLRTQSQGMNAHLMRVWMVFHPPLIFIAYAFILAPCGAALEALARGSGEWRTIAGRYGRTGWLILSAGLAAGMWWAYEDFTFGQFWHWDPVQTSVFVVWALVSAYLHGLRAYQSSGFLARALPLLALVAGVAVLISMMVTRNEILASSHQYIGYTTLPIHLFMTLALVVVTCVAWVVSLRRETRRRRRSEPVLMIRLAVLTFTFIAVVAAAGLAHAYFAVFLDVPRPNSLKPFFETLTRWARPQELSELRHAFAQWDVDNFAVNRWLAPLGIVAGLVGGHTFLRLENKGIAWSITATVAAIALVTALWIHPFGVLYSGTGMTSHYTVDIFPWLDAMLVAAVYLGGSVLIWSARMARRYARRAVYSYFLPVGLIHLGVMVALMAALSASVLDSYAQKVLSYPEDFGATHRFPDGYALTVTIERDGSFTDGGRSLTQPEAFHAVANVALRLDVNGGTAELGNGNTMYRDDRAPMTGERGAVRQLCEILDYRYARYAGGPTYMLDPFIHRGLWRDVQVWVPPVDYARVDGASPLRQPTEVSVVIKTYPMMTWIWVGLALIILGASVMTAFAWFGRRVV